MLRSILSIVLSPLLLLSLLPPDSSMASTTSAVNLVKTGLSPKFATVENLKDWLQTASPNLALVIRLAERRVYVYKSDRIVTSYPIAIGRNGWETPIGEYQVIQMIEDPTWEHPLNGDIIPPGPENPLGSRWIGFWTDGTNYIGFHGTPNEETVGQAVSHGCVRMFNQDVLALFQKVQLGTPVIVEP